MTDPRALETPMRCSFGTGEEVELNAAPASEDAAIRRLKMICRVIPRQPVGTALIAAAISSLRLARASLIAATMGS
jgi:hypothetical protein